MNTTKRWTFRDVVYISQYGRDNTFIADETILRADLRMTLTKAIPELEMLLSRAELINVTKDNMVHELFHEFTSILIHTIQQDPTLCESHIPTLNSLQRTLKTFLPKPLSEDQPLPKPSWNRSDASSPNPTPAR
jgi:hypothetical protein